MKPFFKPEDFQFIDEDRSVQEDRPQHLAEEANRLIEPLLTEREGWNQAFNDMRHENNGLHNSLKESKAEIGRLLRSKSSTDLITEMNSEQIHELLKENERLRGEIQSLERTIAASTEVHLERFDKMKEQLRLSNIDALNTMAELNNLEGVLTAVQLSHAKLEEENDRLRSAQMRTEAELVSLRNEIEQAPVERIYESSSGWKTTDDKLEGVRYFTAQLVRIEPIGPEKEIKK